MSFTCQRDCFWPGRFCHQGRSQYLLDSAKNTQLTEKDNEKLSLVEQLGDGKLTVTAFIRIWDAIEKVRLVAASAAITKLEPGQIQ
jgi:hypothetical protein